MPSIYDFETRWDRERKNWLVAINHPRRNLLLVGAAALTVASCSGNVDVITTVEQLIQKVQAGVVAACAAVGKFVPTVDTVIAVVSGFLNSTLVAANVADALKFVQQAIDAIAAQCPQQPSPSPSLKASVNGKDVPIVFY